MSKLIRQFEPCTIGNGWGNYVDIENFKYDLISMQSLPLIKNKVYSYKIDTNKNVINDDKNVINDNKNNKNITTAVANLIIRVSSTTVVTVAFACFVYCAL
jgi:hypothetical protein